MGFYLDHLRDRMEKEEAEDTTKRNKNAAEQKINKRKDKLIEDLSGYGSVFIKDKGMNDDSLSKYRYSELGYQYVWLHEDYDEYWATYETEHYLSGYSGTVSSSGSVNLSPEYSSYQRQVIKNKKSNSEEVLYVKVVKEENCDEVKRRENEFLAAGGNDYLKISENALQGIKRGEIFLPKKVWKLRLITSIIYFLYSLMYACSASILLFSDRLYMNLDIELPSYFYWAAIVIIVVGLVICLPFTIKLVVNENKMEREYNTKDAVTEFFVRVLPVCLAISLIFLILVLINVVVGEWEEMSYSTKMFAYILEWVDMFIMLVGSLIYLARSAYRKYAGSYFGMEELDGKKIAKLEKMAAEIRTYTLPIIIDEHENIKTYGQI